MQAEEIIQEKEWHQLSAEDKKVLEPLVADEQEFNLLKKMLLVADEAGEDVPSIAPAVQEQLSQSVKHGGNSRSERKIWMYAAASIVLVVVAAWFYLHTTADNNRGIAGTPPEKKTDSPVVINSPLKNEAVKDSQGPIKHPEIIIQDRIVKKEIQIAPSENKDQQIAFINTSTLLKDDTELMSLITEVY